MHYLVAMKCFLWNTDSPTTDYDIACVTALRVSNDVDVVTTEGATGPHDGKLLPLNEGLVVYTSETISSFATPTANVVSTVRSVVVTAKGP